MSDGRRVAFGLVPGSGHTSKVPAFDLVLVVASLGGLSAVSTVLTGLPRSFPAAIVVAHHRPAGSDDSAYAEILRRRSGVDVRIAACGDRADVRGVTIVPAGSSARVRSDWSFELSPRPQDRPNLSGDQLLGSAAAIARGRALGVVLTGRLSDGAEGVRALKRGGGRVLVEDPSSARAAEMPRSAIATGCVDHVLPLSRIAAALVALVMAPGGAELLAVPMPAWAQLGA